MLGIDPSLITGYAETTLLFSWKLPTWCHVGAMRIVMNADKW